MEKIYIHLGYYSDLNDIQRLYDKTDDYVVEEMIKENGCFHEGSDEEITRNYLKNCDATFLNVDGKEYAVTRDFDWDISDLDELDADSDEDNDTYDRNPSFIDIYVLKEE